MTNFSILSLSLHDLLTIPLTTSLSLLSVPHPLNSLSLRPSISLPLISSLSIFNPSLYSLSLSLHDFIPLYCSLSLTPPLCSSISLTSSHPTLCRLFLYISNFMPPYCSLYYSTPVLLYMSHIVPPYCVQAWKDPTGAGLGGRWHPGRRLLHPPRDKYPPPGRFKKMMNSSFSSYYCMYLGAKQLALQGIIENYVSQTEATTFALFSV